MSKISEAVVKHNKRNVVKLYCINRFEKKEGPCKSCKFRDSMDSSCIFEIRPIDWK